MADAHWSQIEETTKSAWKFRFMLWAAVHLPQKIIELIAAVVVFFFFLGASEVRKRSRLYLMHVGKLQNRQISSWDVYLHILSFALSMVEKIQGWAGKISLSGLEIQKDDIESLVSRIDSGKGSFILCSHLGNIEAMRSLTEYHQKHSTKEFQVFPVVDFSGTRRFNDLLQKLNPELMKNCFDANSIGVETAISMREKMASGNLVAIAGDRTSGHSQNRFIPITFLGEKANFPEGAFVLANALKFPVYFIFAFRKRDLDIASPYEFHIIRSKTNLETCLSRSEKATELAKEYVCLLERYCLEHPYQWYNFYNFWQKEN